MTLAVCNKQHPHTMKTSILFNLIAFLLLLGGLTNCAGSDVTRRPPPQVIWQNGKPYAKGPDGKLHPLPPKQKGNRAGQTSAQQHQGGNRQSSQSNNQIVMINNRPYVIVNGQAIPIASNSSNSGNRSYGSGSTYSSGEKRAYQTYVFKTADSGVKLRW